MKNVLYIVYYFPPMGSSGVQRPLKFVKYLNAFGWNPIVLTPHPGAYHTFDESLQEELDRTGAEVHRVDAKTPFHALGGKSRQIQFIPDRLAETARLVSSFFYIPDNKTGWIKPAVKKADEIIRKRNIDLVFSTSPPPSNHLIAAELGKKHRLPVVMDFRDDWLEYQSVYYPTRFHKRKNARLEKDTIQTATAVVANNSATLESIRSRTDNGYIRYEVISHGFDPDDFQSLTPESDKPDKFVMLHSGLFYQERQPDVFLKALRKLVEREVLSLKSFEIWFQGGLEARHTDLIEKLGLGKNLVDFGYVNHKEAVQHLLDADMLWFIVNHSNQSKTVTPGKLYEYMAARKPILGLIGDGDSRMVLDDFNAGLYCNPDDEAETARLIGKIYQKWKNNELPAPNEACIAKYDRRQITGQLADLFNEILEMKGNE